MFYKKVVYNKVVLDCSESLESSILDFCDLRKSINSYPFKIQIFTQAGHLIDLRRIYFLC